MVDWDHPDLGIRRQCQLLGLNRSTLYFEGSCESIENLEVMRLLDEQYLKTPFYGRRRMTAWLRRKNFSVNPKRVSRLMRLMGIEAVYPKPRTSKPSPGHRIYPYLLRGRQIHYSDQVWATDITYIPMARGFMYLVALMDWFSRYVLTWRLSNTLDADFCVVALAGALKKSTPEIFNSDQGSQFTSSDFTGPLEEAGVRISMDGRGRAIDNIFIERLWRTVKYENIYLNAYETVPALQEGLSRYFSFYNNERLHQSLGYQTPAEVYFGTSL